MNSKHSEDQLILQWMNDERNMEKGLRALMEKYQERLYWHIRRMVLNHDDADDVLQNTFIKVYKSIGQFEQKSISRMAVKPVDADDIITSTTVLFIIGLIVLQKINVQRGQLAANQAT